MISEISYKDIENFISEIKCGNKRKNNILVPMRSLFKWAFKTGEITENVMDKVENLKVSRGEIFPLADQEITSLLETVDAFYKPYLIVRLYTGMRCGEINALCWTDYKTEMEPNPKIHINKSYVYNQDGDTKTIGSKRYIDCLPIVVEALEEQKSLTGDQKFIFLTKSGDRMTPDHFRNVVWKPALERAEIAYRPPIQTRHTFASMAISAKEDIGWVKNMLGHSSLQMIFRHYYAWIPNNGHINGSLMSLKQQNDGEKTEGETENDTREKLKVSQKRHNAKSRIIKGASTER
jgi:integrase